MPDNSLLTLEPTLSPDWHSGTFQFDMLMAWTRGVSQILKAMAHQGRFLILALLVDGEKSVSELQEALALPQPIVSSHLARLRFDKLITARRRGRAVYYSLADPRIITLICAFGEGVVDKVPPRATIA